MNGTITQIGREIEQLLKDVDLLKRARAVLAKRVPGHPYSKPKLTVAKLKVIGNKGKRGKKKHWTHTKHGREILAARSAALAAKKRDGR